jgi:hypothetical protein
LAALVTVPVALLATAGGSAVAAGSNTLTVKAGEYTYQLSGSPKGGLTQITFDNAGIENHMMVVAGLKKGTTGAQFKKALLSDDDAAFGAVAAPGGDPFVPGVPAFLGPGQKTTTLTQLPAGTYGIACFVPAPDGSPHAAHGMYKIFTVKGKSNLKPPTSGVAEVTMNDTTITVPPGDAPKDLTVKVTNSGTSEHSFQLLKLADGKTLDDAKAYFDTLFETGKPPDGEAPGTFVGGVSEVAPNGGVGYVEWKLPSGNYAYVSTDGDEPNDDYTKGMHGTFAIS